MLRNQRMERTWPPPISSGFHVTGRAFVGISGSLKAGHAAHPRCSPDDEAHRWG
jgi:hypothetical protein